MDSLVEAITAQMERIPIAPFRMDAISSSPAEHSDHIKEFEGSGSIISGIVYANEKTWQAMAGKRLEDKAPRQRKSSYQAAHVWRLRCHSLRTHTVTSLIL